MSADLAKADGRKMIELARHAIGHGRRGSNRNYFCAGIDSDDARLWWTLVGLGLARAGATINEGSDIYFHVTDAGMKWAKRRGL